MTLNDIIVAALMQLDRDHDSQTLAVWREKFTRFANDAVTDVSTTLRPRRTDTVAVTNQLLDTGDLTRACKKILAVHRDATRIPFVQGPSSSQLRVKCSDGDVCVTYEYMPQPMTLMSDIPDLPKWCHGLIVTYVVGRERASGDVSTQRGANIYFELYQDAKKSLQRHMGEMDCYQIINRW